MSREKQLNEDPAYTESVCTDDLGSIEGADLDLSEISVEDILSKATALLTNIKVLCNKKDKKKKRILSVNGAENISKGIDSLFELLQNTLDMYQKEKIRADSYERCMNIRLIFLAFAGVYYPSNGGQYCP